MLRGGACHVRRKQSCEAQAVDNTRGEQKESALEDVPLHPANVNYLDKLEVAWRGVLDHHVFNGVVARDPLSITVPPLKNASVQQC